MEPTNLQGRINELELENACLKESLQILEQLLQDQFHVIEKFRDTMETARDNMVAIAKGEK